MHYHAIITFNHDLYLCTYVQQLVCQNCLFYSPQSMNKLVRLRSYSEQQVQLLPWCLYLLPLAACRRTGAYSRRNQSGYGFLLDVATAFSRTGCEETCGKFLTSPPRTTPEELRCPPRPVASWWLGCPLQDPKDDVPQTTEPMMMRSEEDSITTSS